MQETLSHELLFVLGAAIVLAYVGALLLKKAGIPQTLGFMIAGIILGLLGIATDEIVHSLTIFVSLALGLIGYNIGHELRSENLTGRLRNLSIIVIFEATAAFWLVSLLTYILVQQLHVALLFGAVASATAPAATADVVWECDCEGPVTSSLMFVLAADDMIAVILTNFAIAYAMLIFAPATTNILLVFVEPLIKIAGSAIIGAIFGYIFVNAVARECDRAKLLELELGMVLLLIGLISILGFSDIFAAMIFGYIVSKNIPDELEPVPDLLQRIMAPIIMVFFVLVGARMAHLLTIETTILTVTITAVIYLVGRTIAKYVGTRVGAKIIGEDERIQKYLGTCLFCQAGVALGLSFIIEEQFVALGGAAAEIGILILGVVALSTMILEGIGPLSVKHSLQRAGELPEEGAPFEPHVMHLEDPLDATCEPTILDDDHFHEE